MAFHFFTGESSINTSQTENLAFGQMSDDGNLERYNLENKFSVVNNASVYSITKSLLIAIEDESDSSLINLALLPISENYTAGFPINFFLYRGILKSSILNADDTIKSADASWDSNNILKIIQDLQTKINEDNGTSEEANATCLGLQFAGLPNDTSLESIFSNQLDDFHPLIIPKGCQIGKFSGGSVNAGIQVVLDKIGYETSLEIFKSSEHFFQIEKLVIDNSLPEKEKLKLRFINRHKKEEVLAYMDITAFYGACTNQGYKISGIDNSTDYLNTFYNRKSVYIDIRDERGFSFNHFYKLEDSIDIGFYNTVDDEPVFLNTDYYQNWPILKIDNSSYSTSKEYFYLKMPVLVGMPVNANIITAFTKKVSIGKNKRDIRYHLLNQRDREGNISLKKSEHIRLKNWKYDDDDDLGANYFLLKIDRIQGINKTNILSTVWNSFFNLKMKHIFNTDDIVDGEFRVKTYSSLNAPLLTNAMGDEIYYPTIGVAADKYHITFFSFYRESAYRNIRKNNTSPLKFIETGKYYYVLNPDKLDYQTAEQAVGFLYQITKKENVNNFELSQLEFSDTENNLTDVKFLKYLKTGEPNEYDDFFENFEAITLTHDEYNHLKSLESVAIADSDYLSEHPLFIRSKEVNRYEYKKFRFIEIIVSLGVAKIVGNDIDEVYSVELSEYPNEITIAGESIKLTSIITN